MVLTAPNPQQPITSDGIMEQTFRTWTQGVTNLEIVEGIGSPEGAIEAPRKRLYMDLTPAASPVLYIKQQDNVGGDRTLGWVSV